MSYGISLLAVIPVRAESSDKAEIITQLLFGEHYTVLEEQKKWIHIKIQFDDYEGWICRKQFSEITGQEFEELSINEFPLCSSSVGIISNSNEENTLISRGATLPFLHQNRIKIKGEELKFEGAVNQTNDAQILEYANDYLNTPYLWGGRSPLGIDCSGFAQVVYKLCGHKLPRDAYQQAEEGFDISFIEMTEAGDLAFFDNEEGRINHVGIIIEPGKIIHASGRVKIDKLDHQGIYSDETKSYTHKLRLIKRIF
ncbi:MAG: hypothetical protein ACI8Q1_000130 [Parvicella sp.]|jgi:hypothetical protein